MSAFLEYFGVLTGLLYLVLEIRQHRSMWVVGFVTSLVYVFVFFFSKFYADMGLNVYYVGMSAYGFYRWGLLPVKGESETSVIRYCRLKSRQGILVAGATVLLYIGIYYILDRFTDSPVPEGDAFTTALSITATWLLAKRVIEHWGMWVVINGVSAWLYYERGLYPTVFLFVCYGVLAVVGFANWKKKGIRYDCSL